MNDKPDAQPTPVADALFAKYANATKDRTTIAAEMASKMGELESALATAREELGIWQRQYEEKSDALDRERTMREDCARIANGYFDNWKAAEQRLAVVEAALKQAAKEAKS